MNMTLKSKVVAATSLLVMVIMTVAGFASFSFFKLELLTMIFRDQNALAVQVAGEADGKLITARRQLDGLADLIAPDAARDARSLHQLLQREDHLCRIFTEGIFIIDLNGKVMANVPPAPLLAPAALEASPEIRDLLRTTKGFSRPFRSATGHPLVAVATPLDGVGGSTVAVMVGVIDLLHPEFLGGLSRGRFGKDGYAFLFDENRTLIIHPDQKRIMSRPAVGLNRMFDRATKGNLDPGEATTSYGKRMVVSFSQLESTRWIVGVNYPAAEAFAPIATAERWFVMALAAVLCVSMAIINLFMRHILRPLGAFTEHVAGMAGVDATETHFTASCGGEIRILANAFNGMVDRIAAQRKHAMESETLFRSVIDNSAVPTFVIDADHRVIAWNKACEEMTGVLAEEVLGTDAHWRGFYSFKRPTLADLVIGDVTENLEKYYAAVERSPLVPDGLKAERWLPGVGGKDRYVLFEAAPVYRDTTLAGAIETLQDLTERKIAEDKVTKLRDFYLTLFEGFPALIWRSGPDTNCDYFNKTWLDFTGRSLEQEVGNGWVEGVHPDDLDRCLKIYLEAFGRRESFAMEYRLRHHSGMYRWILDVGRPFTDIDGEFAGYVGVCYDMTERKEVEESLARSSEELEEAYSELKRTQSQVLQQEKMASIGQLAAGVAHEINNPMGFIFSNLGTLGKYVDRIVKYLGEAEGSLPEERAAELAVLRKELKIGYIINDIRQLVEESLEGAERVRKIVLDLKGFSRVDDTEEKFVDLNSCLDSTLNIVWNEIKYVATLRKEYGELPQVRCFPQQINQVFMNTLVNAAHAIKGQGEIIVRTWQEGESVFVSIRDTGCGIPPENLNKIFEPFFTTKEVGKGTGLGLSITYDIIKKHNGEIMLNSEVGQGTDFTIRLPIGGCSR